MGIEAILEVSNEQYLPLEDNVYTSKPIASFCTSALAWYCHLRSQDESGVVLDANDRELFDWFVAIESRMTTDLCLLSKALSGFWHYSSAEYARYVEDIRAYLESILNPENSEIKLLSEEEFRNACAEDGKTWTDTA